jgi:hypothetical protein
MGSCLKIGFQAAARARFGWKIIGHELKGF